MDIKNLSIVRQTFAGAVFTHKVQEVAAEVQGKKSFKVKVGNIILVSLVLILLIVQASLPENIVITYLGLAVAGAEIIFLIIQLSFSFEQKAIMHKNSALKYMGLRDNYRLLIADIMSEDTSTISDKLNLRRNMLQEQYQVISDLAPQTGPEEYMETQKRLNKKGVVSGEEFTWSDEEIDWFLPESLRLKQNGSKK